MSLIGKTIKANFYKEKDLISLEGLVIEKYTGVSKKFNVSTDYYIIRANDDKIQHVSCENVYYVSE